MSRSTYDVWLLDLDGTLVDTEWGYIRECFDRVGDRVGHEFTDRDAKVIWNGLGGSRDAAIRERDIDPDSFWSAFHGIEDPHKRAEATYLYDDATLVGEIDAPVGLVTHCQRFLTDPVLDALDIRDWFDTVVCCTDQTGWKPDPGPVNHALTDLDVNSRNGILVGDSASDVGAAWNAGLTGAHIERHHPRRRGYCVLSDHQVEAFDSLPGLNSD